MSRVVPRVPGHPLLGSLSEFRNSRIGLLTRLASEYGDIARIDVGFLFHAVVISSPELAHEALVAKDEAFVKGLGLSVFAKPLLGNGLLTSEHELHKRQRRMMAPAFVHRRIADYAATIASYTDRCVERLRGLERADLSREMMQLTFEIVGKTLFDADLSGDANDAGEALTRVMEHITDQISSVIPIPPIIPSPANLRGRRIIRRLDEVVYRMIR